MNKHTPGPWHPVQYGPYHNIQSTPYYDEDPVNLLDLQECDRAEYNAKLCASAPELLKALQGLNEALDAFWNSDKKPDSLVEKINKEQQKSLKAIQNTTEL